MDEKRITKLRTRFAPGILNALITAAGNDARLAYVEKSALDKVQREREHAAKKAAECGKLIDSTFIDRITGETLPCNLPSGHEGNCDVQMRGGLLMPEPIDPATLVTVSAYDVDKITDLALDYADVLARKALAFDEIKAQRKKELEIEAAVAAERAASASGASRFQVEEVNGGRSPVPAMPVPPNPAPSLS